MDEQKALLKFEILKATVVRTPNGEQPYKVVLEHRGGGSSEHPVSSVREGEALIRSKGGWNTSLLEDLRAWNGQEDEPRRLLIS